MRLIDADNVRDLFDAEFKETRKLILAGGKHLDNLAEGFTEADRVIRQMPTVDAVPVVRCKDCKYAYINSFSASSGVALCTSSGQPMQQDDFCSYGERKEGA